MQQLVVPAWQRVARPRAPSPQTLKNDGSLARLQVPPKRQLFSATGSVLAVGGFSQNGTGAVEQALGVTVAAPQMACGERTSHWATAELRLAAPKMLPAQYASTLARGKTIASGAGSWAPVAANETPAPSLA